MTEFIKLQTPQQSIQIGFPDQKVSGRAGLLTFAGFLHWHRFAQLLARVLPHQRTSKKAIPMADLALGFLAGILAGAQKLAPVAYLRSDVMFWPSSVSAVNPPSRAFSKGSPARAKIWARSVRCGAGAWSGCPAARADTRWTWIRRGGCTRTAINVVAFTLDLLANIPKWIGLRLVRADPGFCVPEWLDLLERLKLQYLVVARLLKPLQRLLKKDLIWTATDVPDTEVAEVWHQEVDWPAPRRVILLRHRIADKQKAGQRTGGKGLVDCPGYLYQGLVTHLPASVPPIEVWRQYNPRAGLVSNPVSAQSNLIRSDLAPTSCSMDKTGQFWETTHYSPGLLASDDFRARLGASCIASQQFLLERA